MSEDIAMMIRETAERLFTDHCDREVIGAATAGQWPSALWDEIEATGLTLAMVSEERNGAGLPVKAALTLLEVAAEFAAPVPLAETMVAAWLLDRAGLDVPTGPLSLARLDGSIIREGGGWRLSGTARRVPWGARAQVVIVADVPDGTRIAVVDGHGCSVEGGANVAGEPRDTLFIDCICEDENSANSPVSAEELDAIGAAMRTIQIAGGLKRATNLALQYAQDRSQFGRSLAKFQAIQQNLAVLATQTALAAMAATMARDALAEGALLPSIAIAKANAGEAAGVGAAIAHQVHGAIGFTLEHDLQFYTKRLYAWRDEFGNETEWNHFFGSYLASTGANGLWAAITDAA